MWKFLQNCFEYFFVGLCALSKMYYENMETTETGWLRPIYLYSIYLSILFYPILVELYYTGMTVNDWRYHILYKPRQRSCQRITEQELAGTHYRINIFNLIVKMLLFFFYQGY